MPDGNYRDQAKTAGRIKTMTNPWSKTFKSTVREEFAMTRA
jgi:hypothetical protein